MICGSFTENSTGNQSFTIDELTKKPTYARFTISGRTGTDETITTFSTGFTDGTRQKTHSMFRDATGARTRAYTDRCINHFARPSTSIVSKIQAEFVSFDDNGGGSYGYTLHFTAADGSYLIAYEIE